MKSNNVNKTKQAYKLLWQLRIESDHSCSITQNVNAYNHLQLLHTTQSLWISVENKHYEAENLDDLIVILKERIKHYRSKKL